MRIYFCAILFFSQGICSSIYSQHALNGKIVDRVTKEPLELAVISCRAKGVSGISDREGKFILKGIASEDSMAVSMIGYMTLNLTVGMAAKLPFIEMVRGPVDLREVTITGHSNNLTTSHILSSIDLNLKPINSAQDMLRMVPGLFIAQHQGGGKAEQIFLRGFDADHGTDVNVSVDGLPVNLVSQAHGQGYADLHFVIPETIERYDFGKGPYYANEGDFCTAGYISYHTLNIIPKSSVKLEAGQFGTVRGVAMINLLGEHLKSGGQSAYVAAEGMYTNGGPFDVPEHFNRFNFFGKFITTIGSASVLTLTASSLSSRWRAAGEIPNRAQAEGYIKDPFGSIDSAQGGEVTRSNAMIKVITKLQDNFSWENMAYYSHCNFNLISNFTYFFADPVNGDEFNQHEKRELTGYKTTLSQHHYFAGSTLSSVAGLEIRYDYTHPSWLSHTLHGDSTLNYIQRGNIRELSSSAFLEESFETGRWILNGGVRFDYFAFDYLNSAPGSDSAASAFDGQQRSRTKAIISPKLNIQFSASNQCQIFLKMGKGFHSNDTRVVIANQGTAILPAAYGLDLGVNLKPAERWFINASLWYLFLQQEFVYGADFGQQSVMPGPKTTRKGFDLSARFQFAPWLFGNLNLDLAVPRAAGLSKGENYLPLAPTCSSTAGLFYQFRSGLSGGISYRYLHDRPADSSYSVTAKGYFITDLSVNFTKEKFEFSVVIENLLNQKWNEGQFAYLSRLKNEQVPVYEISNTPGVPFFAKFKLTYRF